MKTTYNSKVSKALAILSYGLLFGCFVPAILHDFNIPILLLFLFLQWLITQALFGIAYTIDGHELRVKALMYNKVFDIRKIKRISSSHNLLSAPAASVNRLEIKFDNEEKLLISPRREQLFIEQICEINPDVVVKA